MSKPVAEDFARPSYKWLGERRFLENARGWRVSLFPGGIGFSFFNYSDHKNLRVTLRIAREDGVIESYLVDAYYCGEWGGPWQKWQASTLPLFPYESLHGQARHVTFSYAVLRDAAIVPSRFQYRFATLEDFHRGWLSPDDFEDPSYKIENEEPLSQNCEADCHEAYERLNGTGSFRRMTPFFTRGDTGRANHPVHAIHMAIDRVVERKLEDPDGDHAIRLAVYDFDNGDIATHLVYAKNKGVLVECIGEWTQVSTLNASENVAHLRRASIPVYGFIRNDPCRLGQDISSMHTKFVLFDDDLVHSASYNLHFHLWGGNWENGVSFRSRDASLLYRAIYDSIRHGSRVKMQVDPGKRYNLYYSFGRYEGPDGPVRPQDVIVSEILKARHSIVVCMFELARLKGTPTPGVPEIDVIEALIQARDRGVQVRIIVNGMMAHRGPEPAPWDKEYKRPLKEPIERLRSAWIEVYRLYYWDSIYSPLHHKFAVVDGLTIITGSYNWYEPSLYSDEILTVTRDEALAAAYLEEAELMLRSFMIERG
jgi:phosphatidylserine/phosphatidylglycerophosphate/cardiolipin synthase-like enzyme